MPRFTYALVGGVIALVGLLAFSYSRSNRFEQQARDATRFAHEQRDANKILNDQLTASEARAQKRAPVIADDRKRISEVDVSNPPPDTCSPNIAARDQTIADQQDQILDLSTALARSRQISANSDRAADSLQKALDARPKPLLRLPFLEIGLPKLGLFGGVCVNGGLCGGAGVIVPIQIGGK